MLAVALDELQKLTEPVCSSTQLGRVSVGAQDCRDGGRRTLRQAISTKQVFGAHNSRHELLLIGKFFLPLLLSR